MLYKIGTVQEVSTLASRLPQQVLGELLRGIVVLDAEYGVGRDYLQIGGYSVVVETTEDTATLKDILDYDTQPSEWVTRIGRDTGFLSALYILNDDFSVIVYLPIAIAPDAILENLEED